MSTVRRFRWLKYVFCLMLLVGMSGHTTFAAPENSGTDVVEFMFWQCLLDDHKPTTTQSASQCCDGDGCYTCLSDFSECWISSDTSSSAQITALQSQRPNIRPMQESPSEGQLQGVCTRVGADFTSLKGFGYTCVKPNCNGKGDYCSIVCHGDRRCTAGTPDVLRGPVSLIGILQNGDNIFRTEPDAKEDNGGGGGSDGDGGNKDRGSPCPPGDCLY